MRGESRCQWQHEIVSGQKRRREKEGGGGGADGKEWRRVSLTFRVEKKKEKEKRGRMMEK